MKKRNPAGYAGNTEYAAGKISSVGILQVAKVFSTDHALYRWNVYV